uniref:nucleolin n=1 Tax=Pristiophorus japonicus TaxID=55135 RepID=UPI00398E8EA9
MVKLAKADKKQGKPKKAAPPPPPEDFEESTSEEESEDEELPVAPVKKAATPAAKTPQSVNKKNGKAVKKESSEEEDEEEEEEEDDEEDDGSEEESEEEKPVAKHAAALTKKAKEESDDEDEDEDESEEEEAMDTAPPPKAKKAGMVKVQEDDEDEDEDDEDEDDDDDEEDSEDEEEIAVPKKAGKRKKEEQKAMTPAKKQKTESDGAFSLFVGNLNSEKSFEELKKALNDFFTKKKLSVTDVRIGSSRKFGYVDFESEEQLEKALEFNGNKVMGHAVKLDKARSKESNADSKRERDYRTLFVKNLPFKITQNGLKEIFEDAIDIRIPAARDGSGTRGIAYIEFENEAAADKALEQKQGTDVEGRYIVIDFTGDKSMLNVKGGQTQPDSDTLIVNNLAYSATEETLQGIFEKASLIRIPEKNGRPKGFAFVKFESIEDAKEALENHGNTEIEGRTVRLDFSNQGQRSGDGPSKTLFIRGLSDDTTEDTLKEAFEGAESARIATDRDSGRSKGFGFVDFPSEEDAKSAKETMEDGEIDGCKITLDFARPKGESQRGGRGFGRARRGRGSFGGRGRGGRGGGAGRGGFGGFRGGKTTPQGKKIKFD